MTSSAAQPARRGRPRIVLSQACPKRPVPVPPEVDLGDLKRAERTFLERKVRELAYTNMRNDFPFRPARRHGDPEPGDIFYPNIQAYRRMELSRRGAAAVDKFWALHRDHHYFRLTLTAKPTGCPLHHAQRLQDVRRYIWWRISKFVTGHVRSLHLDASDRLHWDYVLALPVARETEFEDMIRALNRQIYGSNGPRDVRIWTKRILRNRKHVERSVDYCLRARRYDRDLTHKWYAESFLADAHGGRLGISRRRIVRFKQPAQTPPDGAQALCTSPPRKPGRPPKSAGSAYRQRKRRKSNPAPPSALTP